MEKTKTCMVRAIAAHCTLTARIMESHMPASFLEIVELPTGEIVLRRSDEDGEPLLTINFSEEAKFHLEGVHLHIAKVMFDAGMKEVAELANLHFAEEGGTGDRVLH